jgi:hypothetical protein
LMGIMDGGFPSWSWMWKFCTLIPVAAAFISLDLSFDCYTSMIILNLILKFLVFRCLKQITSGVLISFFHFLGSHDSQKSLSYRSCSSVPSKSWSYEVLYETVQVLLLHIFHRIWHVYI